MFRPTEKMDTAFLRALPQPNQAFLHKRVISKKGKIKSTRRLNYDSIEITVLCEEGDGLPPILASAGQYATLLADAVGSPRAFSFCRAPSNDQLNEHTFLIRLVPGGRFSGWLFEKDRTGTELTVTGPLGTFGLDESNRGMVCIAGGSGISAVKALLEEAVSRQVRRDCIFIYGGRTKRDLYYGEEMARLQAEWHPEHKLEFIQVLSEEPFTSSWEGPRGLVSDFVKKAYLDRGKFIGQNCAFYVCGPPPMVEATEAMLAKGGVPKANIAFDKFSDAQSPAPVIDNTKCVLCEECLYVRPIEDCIVEISALGRSNGNGLDEKFSRIRPGETAGLYYTMLLVNEEKCIRCFSCVEACPVGAFAPQKEPKHWALSRLVS